MHWSEGLVRKRFDVADSLEQIRDLVAKLGDNETALEIVMKVLKIRAV